mmetsp:Transcript_27552/g.60170  ORF Transcript_27552/g.60170 Transcript_27552/m.60170 type:complete len:219 (+) Transcript_27552:316-972(+)
MSQGKLRVLAHLLSLERHSDETKDTRHAATLLARPSWRTIIYSITTSAPTSFSLAIIASASSFLTSFLITTGTASTRSFASFSPRSVTARISLITLILAALSKLSNFRSNSVFSSAASAAGAAPPAVFRLGLGGMPPMPIIIPPIGMPVAGGKLSFSCRISTRSFTSSSVRFTISPANSLTFSLPFSLTCGLSRSIGPSKVLSASDLNGLLNVLMQRI